MKKILAIDDQSDNLTTIKAIMKNFIPDCEVLTALSGKEGIKIAREEQPDTILLDIIMPQMDGYEVCKRLKEDELTKHIPVVMITAIKTDTESLVKGLNIGADAFFTKPIDPVELSAQVNVMLRIKEAEDKLRGQKETFEDVVIKKKSELMESEERFRLMLEQSPSVIELYDLTGLQIGVNKAYEVLWGFPASHTVGKFNVLKSKEVESTGLMEYVKRAYAGESVLVPEYKFNPKGPTEARGRGRVRWLNTRIYPLKDTAGIVTNIVITHEDITKVKESAKLIMESENKYRTMIERSNDMIWTLDTKGNFTFFNKQVEEITGFLFKDWKGKSFAPLIRERDLQYIQDIFKRSIEGEAISYELTLNIPDGKNLILSVNTAPILADNKISGIVSFGRNITAQKEAELKLIKALKKATESDRLKSVFLASMSHELRTPLNAIIGFSDIIDEELSTEEIIDFSKTINASGKHLMSIIEDLFDITMIESGEIKTIKENFELGSVLSNVHEIIKIEQHKTNKDNIELKLTIPQQEKNLTINTDPSKLEQILINLLKNALKFTNEGHVHYGYSLKTNSKPGSTEQSRSTELKFFVKDTGIGIPDNKQELIFDIFRQAEDTHTRGYGGTGIGLSISKKLTELLGGKIWLESKKGKGSTFYFTIPYEECEITHISNEVEEEKEKGKEKKSKIKKKSILIVEDVEASYEFLKIVLEKSGNNTIWAKDGEESVKLCKENTNIDLVLMDINMSEMNGYEATKEIKKIHPNLPIIAQTAYAIAGDREKSLAAGCDDYISKPIKKEVLMGKIVKWLSG
ncbi:MAG: response regulator [Bacteroidales bacterium]|nr:response regulator [Bacteroidales bacterium]